ncbi:hypothetical protein [Rhizocola hellebori]|nr:hypothetical protein [Rhizocola hellebori]
MTVARALLAVPLAGLLLTGCASTRFTECALLKPEALPAGLAGLKLAHQEQAGSESIRCEWRAAEAAGGPVTVKANVTQPVSYTEGQTRADSAMEDDWERDDRVQVTHRVPGLGDGGYRYTAIYDDVVTVTVKAFDGFRIVKIEASAPYTSEENLAALEAAAEAVASMVVVAK